MKNKSSERVRSHFKEFCSKMPELSHWPDRSVPFDYAKSEVCSWILSQPEIRQWIFDKARNMNCIKFDPDRQTWKGVG